MITTSTYRTDFAWPFFYSSGSKRKVENISLEAIKSANDAKNPCLQEKARKEREDRKGIPAAKMGATPVGPESKFDQPDAFLRKLFEKYPYMYNVLKMTTEEQLKKKLEVENNKTTYQVDFGKEGHVPKDNYDELIDLADSLKEEERKKRENEQGEVCKCQMEPRPCLCKQKKSKKPVKLTSMPRPPREPKKSKKEADKTEFKGKGKPPNLKGMKSEYGDTISRVGRIIIKEKLHFKEEIPL